MLSNNKVVFIRVNLKIEAIIQILEASLPSYFINTPVVNWKTNIYPFNPHLKKNNSDFTHRVVLKWAQNCNSQRMYDNKSYVQR